jgi:hypothetical protein
MANAKRKVEETLPVANGGGAAGVPNFLATTAAEDMGKGTSTAQEDNLVPLIYILQPLSPVVNKKDPNYVEGAEPGAIWLRNSADPVAEGDKGILFQPCYFSKDYVEWVPRNKGGGFVGRHGELPADVKEVRDEQNPNKVKYIRPNGNEVIETRYHAGFVITDNGPLPYVIPMTSTAHTSSRQWMVMMNGKQLNGKRLPSWSSIYRLRTKQKTNNAGTWYTWDISDAGYVQSTEEYERGKALFNSFTGGEKKFADDEHHVATDEDAPM